MTRAIIVALVATLSLASAAHAQSAASNPAASPTTSAPAFSVKTPISSLVTDAGAKAVLERDLPHLLTHPMYDTFKELSLEELQPLSNGAITADLLAKVNADLAKITPGRTATPAF